MLSKNVKRELRSLYHLTDDDIDVFENPDRRKIVKFISRIKRGEYDRGYHQAIEDIKQITSKESE